MIRRIINFFLLFALPVFSLEIIQVDEFTQELNISQNLEYYLDESKQWRIEEILKLEKRFAPNRKDYLDLGFIDSSIWLQFKVRNNSEKFLTFYLTIPLPALDYAEFYFLSNQTETWNSEIAGDTIPINKWNNPNFLHPTFLIELPQKATRAYLINLRSTSYIRTQIILQNEMKKLSSQNNFLFIERVFYLIVVSLISIAIYLYLKYKQKIIFMFILAVLFYYMNVWLIQGTGYRWLWPNSPGLQNKSQIFFLSLSLIAASQSTKIISENNFLNHFFKNTLNAIIVALLCLSVLCIMETRVQLRIYIFNFIFFIFIFINSVLFYRVILTRKRSSQFYFLLGISGISFFGILSSLLSMGFVPYSSFNLYAITLASPISFIIILFSLWMYSKEKTMLST